MIVERDEVLTVHDARTGQVRWTVKPLRGDQVLAPSPDGATLAIANDRDHDIRLLRMETGEPIRVLSGKKAPGNVVGIADLTWSPDGSAGLPPEAGALRGARHAALRAATRARRRRVPHEPLEELARASERAAALRVGRPPGA